MAFLNFTNAYRVYTAAGNLALKEQNSIDFTYSSLNVARISDGSGGQSFSGNDVPVQLTIGTDTYYGWISRPIKSGGIVRGFYFWSDPQFSSLSTATADGNMDGDGSASDNFGFVLVVDQAYFTQLAGNASAGAILNVGSSSDRVDTSLNSVIPVNSAPIGVNDSVTGNEDATITGNVLSNDTDANNDPLSVTGFSINGVSGTLGTAFTIANVGDFTLLANGNYTFTPVANYNGAVPVVTYTLTDGTASSSAKLSMTVAPVNDPPVSTNDSISILEDATTLLSLADFGTYSDVEGTPIAGVVITSLPGGGTLSYYNGTSWVAVTANQTISATDINAGKLRYSPAANSTTSTSLTYKVSDGTATSTSAYTLNIGITGVNDAPAGTDKTITLNEDTAQIIAASDFGFTDPNDSPANTLSNVIVTSLPRAGSLTLNNVAVTVGQSISAADIAANKLVFTPSANANGNSYASFGFKVQDNGGTANGGADTDPTPNAITFNVTPVNDAPVANNDSGTATYSATSSYRVSASGNVITNDTDVDGDTLTGTRVSAGATLGASPVTIGGIQTVTTNYDITGVEAAAYSVITLKGANVGNIPASGSVTGDSSTAIPSNTTYTKTAGTGSTVIITFSNPVVLTGTSGLTFASGGTSTNYTLVNSGGNADTLTVDTSAVAISSASASLNGASTTIAANMAVTGTNLTSGAKVSSVYTASSSTTSYQIVKLDKTFTSAAPATDYSFATSQTSQVSGGPGVVNGTYGQLSINADGTYTYTPTSGPVSATTDTFTYEIKDPSGTTATAQLVINISTVNAGPPTVAADTKSVTEKYGTANNTGSSSVTVAAAGVLSNDSGASGLRVDQISSQTSTSPSSVNNDGTTATVIAGRYGTLTIYSGGGYTYAVDDSNSTVQGLNAGGTLSDKFTYRATDSGGNFASTTLTITINGANDGPVALDDTGSATESGGTANGVAGSGSSGNVLTNDSDPDSASSGWAVSAVRTGAVEGSGTSGTLGTALLGSYGRLTLNSNGTYTYVVDESLANSLAPGATATDSFNYTILDQAGGYTDTALLTITITGANDAPVNTVPGVQTVTSYSSISFAAGQFAVTDPDGNLSTTNSVKLTVGQGTLSVTGSGGTVTGTGTLADPLIISGTEAQVNARLDTLKYTPNATFTGSDSLLITSVDSYGLVDSDSVAITVSADNRALTVTGTSVNEASPYVLFSVSGASGQYVSLSLGSGTATVGQDVAPALEYYDGNSWQPYHAGSIVQLVGTSLLVRAAVLQDSLAEGSETLTLTALNQNQTSYSGNSTIKDDGTGDVFLADNASLTPSPSNSAGYPASLDDDRALTVDTIRVNEASSHAVFTVTGVANQIVTLALVVGSATPGSDYTSTLEYYDGNGWVAYSSSATIPTGGVLLVRVPLLADTTYEGPENFGLRAVNGSGVGYLGTATIYDDGTGTKFTGNVVTTGGLPAPETTTSGLDNDLSVTVTAHGPVNEASTYAPFTVEATKGAALQLSLQGSGSSQATVSGFAIQFSYDGTTWFDYSDANTPLVPGSLGTGTDKVFVRVNVTSEQETAADGPETFTLNAIMAAGGVTPLSANAETTLVDAANGTLYSGNFTSGSPATTTGTLDDDRTLTVTGTTVSENSPYAVFKIAGVAGQDVTLALGNTVSAADRDATLGTDTGNAGTGPLQILVNGAWVDYTAASIATIPAGGTLLARTQITNDAVYEGAETFTLIARNLSAVGFTGITTIVDDGSSAQIFDSTNTTDTPTTGTADNDKPTLSISDISTSEGGSAVFTAQIDKQSAYAISFTPSLASGTGTVGTDTAAASSLQVSTDGGVNWSTVSGAVTIAAGQTSLQFKLAITDDTVAELAETFTLSTGAITGGVTNSTGVTATATIAASDAPTLSLTNVSVNEASPYAVLEVRLSQAAASSISFTPALVNGTATAGTDTGSTIQYWTGSTWASASSGVTIAAGTTSLLLRVAITQDTTFEGSESLTLSTGTITGPVTNSQAASGTITVLDDGTGDIFLAGNNSATPNASTDVGYPALDNDMSLQVTAHGPVNEASSYALFTVVADAGQPLNLSVSNTTTNLDLVDDAGSQDDALWAAVEYSTDGTNWTAYTWNGTNGSRPTIPGASGTGTVYVRVRIASEADSVFESSETFKLTAQTTAGAGQSGYATATIVDAGNGSLYSGTVTAGTPNTSAGTLDDDRPSFAVSDVSVSESAGTATVTVTRTGSTLLSSTVDYATSNGTATSGSDYTSTSGSLSFAANETSKSFTINVSNDTLDEVDETLTVTLSNATNAVIGTNTATVTIVDNDTQAVSTVVARDSNVASNVVDTSVVEGTSLIYTVSLSTAASASRTFSFAWSGTASAGDYGTPQFSDGVTLSGGTITVPAGVTSFTVTVPTVDDTAVESDETLILTVGGVSATGTITDNDGNVALTVTSPTVNEASPYAVFTITGTSNNLGLTVSLGSGTATGGGVDYGAASGSGLSYSTDGGATWQTYSGSITATGSSVLVRTPIINDTSPDNGETFTLTATPASGTAGTGTATIADNGTGTVFAADGTVDSGATLDDDRALTINSFSLNEASPYIVWTVQGASGQKVALSLGGTATGGGVDYGSNLEVKTVGGWVSYDPSNKPVLPGSGSMLVRAALVDDAISDDGETVVLSAAPVGGQTAMGTATIRDQGTGTVYNSEGNSTGLTATDDRPTISVASLTVQESEPYAVTSISLSQASSSAISFTPSLVARTATLIADFGPGLEYFNGSTWVSAANGITIAAGKTAVQVRTPLVQDNLTNEGTERFAINTGAVTGSVRNDGGASGTISIVDAAVVSDPVITDVTEGPNDPTPFDLLTSDTTQVVTVTGQSGATVSLFRLGNGQSSTQVAANQFQATETSPGVYQLDFGSNALQAGDYVARLTKNGANSGFSNSFTIDSTPGLFDISARRENVQLSANLTVTNGAVGGLDQNRFPTYWTGTQWLDADGEIIRFSFGGPAQFDKASPPSGTNVTATAPSGSTLVLNTQNGSYTYTPAANAKLDTFTIYASDGNKGDRLKLTFDATDTLDRDGIPSSVESRLALLTNPGRNGGDLNNDGIPDANQNAVTTLAWTTVDKFNSALDGTLNEIRPVIAVQVLQNNSGTTVDDSAQLFDVKVLAPNSPVVGGSKPTNATWDPIQFSIEPLQSVGLVDIDPVRPGIQVRVLIDISNTQVAAGTFTRYMKYVDATAVAAGVFDLDGQAITTPGWYDFTQRTPGGDGARFITSGGLITGIELILTDNGFGDNDPTIGRIFDPGVPTGDATSGGGGGGAGGGTGGGTGGGDATPPVITEANSSPGAQNSSATIPENTKPVTQFTANEPVRWSIVGGPDAGFFALDETTGKLSFIAPPDYEKPADQGANNIYDLTISATDLAGNISTQTVAVRVTDVDEIPPIITGPSNGPGASNSATAIPENTLPVTVFKANEPVTWTITGGPDSGHFTIDTASGALSFTAPPDYEAPTDQGRNNVYDLVITATDVAGNAAIQTVAVTVTNVLEALPVYAAPLQSGDRFLTGLQSEAAQKAASGTSPRIEFYGAEAGANTVPLKAWVNLITGDYFYAPDGKAAPYDCYVPVAAANLPNVLPAGTGAFDVHLYMNGSGITQIMGAQSASALNLLSQGYQDMGVLFASAAPLGSLTNISSFG